MLEAISDKILNITMRAMPVFFAFVTLRAVLIGHRHDHWIPALTAVVLMAALIWISNPRWIKRALYRVVPMWGTAPFRILFALVFCAALLVLRFAVPPSYSTVIYAIFVPAFVLCYLAPGFVFRDVTGLGPTIRPRLRDVPITKLDPVVYWWVKPAGWCNIALLAIGFYGFMAGEFLPSGVWKATSVALAVFLTVPGTAFVVWLSWKLRESHLITPRNYLPDFIFLTVVGGIFLGFCSYFAFVSSVPQIWHLIAKPEPTTLTYIVRSATDHLGRRACRENMTVSPEDNPNLILSICGSTAQRSARDIRPGDLYGVEGRTSWFGQSIDRSVIVPMNR